MLDILEGDNTCRVRKHAFVTGHTWKKNNPYLDTCAWVRHTSTAIGKYQNAYSFAQGAIWSIVRSSYTADYCSYVPDFQGPL